MKLEIVTTTCDACGADTRDDTHGWANADTIDLCPACVRRTIATGHHSHLDGDELEAIDAAERWDSGR